jgi:signal transduction histidine kinase
MAGAQHMARVIDGAMDICRARWDKLRSETEAVDMGRVVAAAIRNSRRVISQKMHQVTLDVPLGKTAVQADATRLELIVTNLLTNSAKYTNPGGKISVVIEIGGNIVTLRVRDNGIGIASDSLTKIFEPYWKGPASDGLGIGLALVKSLVELHGGTIAVYSEGPGLGAEFAVYLPSA